MPEASTSTWSGAQENGASLSVKYPAQPSTTFALPCKAVVPEKNTASSAMNSANAWAFRSAMLRAKATSAAQTWSRAESEAADAGP